MHSDTSGYWANGQVSEFCGELIDSGHKTIRQLASRFGLRVDNLLAAEPRGTDDTYYFFGSYYSIAQADADFAVFNPTVQDQSTAAGYPTTWDSSTPTGRQLDQMSVYDWIDAYVPGGHGSPMGRLLDAAYTEEYGADTTRPGVAEPAVPARLPAQADRLRGLRRLGREIPHRRRKPAAARGDRRTA